MPCPDDVTVTNSTPAFCLGQVALFFCFTSQLITDAVTALCWRLLAKQCSSDLEVQVTVSKITAVFIYSFFLVVGVIFAAVGSYSNLHIHVQFDPY